MGAAIRAEGPAAVEARVVPQCSDGVATGADGPLTKSEVVQTFVYSSVSLVYNVDKNLRFL